MRIDSKTTIDICAGSYNFNSQVGSKQDMMVFKWAEEDNSGSHKCKEICVSHYAQNIKHKNSKNVFLYFAHTETCERFVKEDLRISRTKRALAHLERFFKLSKNRKSKIVKIKDNIYKINIDIFWRKNSILLFTFLGSLRRIDDTLEDITDKVREDDEHFGWEIQTDSLIFFLNDFDLHKRLISNFMLTEKDWGEVAEMGCSGTGLESWKYTRENSSDSFGNNIISKLIKE